MAQGGERTRVGGVKRLLAAGVPDVVLDEKLGSIAGVDSISHGDVAVRVRLSCGSPLW
jgi:hypothetical protein